MLVAEAIVTLRAMMPEAGRLAAHVLLDACTAATGRDDPDAAAVQLAVDRLLELDAMTVKVTDVNDEFEVDVDVSDLVGGAMVTMQYLIHQLAKTTEVDPLIVISKVREHLDEP